MYWCVTRQKNVRLFFSKCAKNKISNRYCEISHSNECCFHLPKTWFVGKINQYQINLKDQELKPYHFTISIWYGTDMFIPDSMEIWETDVNLICI